MRIICHYTSNILSRNLWNIPHKHQRIYNTQPHMDTSLKYIIILLHKTNNNKCRKVEIILCIISVDSTIKFKQQKKSLVRSQAHEN